MKIKLLTICALAAFALAAPIFVSCDKDDDKNDEIKSEWPRKFVGDVSVSDDAPVYSATGDTLVISKAEGVNDRLTVTFKRVKFAERMPAMDVVVPDIPCTIESSGDLTFSGDGIVPTTASGIPVERYTATGLKGSVRGGSISVTVTFGPYLTTYNGKEIDGGE